MATNSETSDGVGFSCADMLSRFLQSCLDPLRPYGLYRQDYWGGLPFPSPGDLPDLGIKPWVDPALKGNSLPLSYPGSPRIWSCRVKGLRGHSLVRGNAVKPLEVYSTVGYICWCVKHLKITEKRW